METEEKLLDLRTRRTRKLLREALMNLLKTNEIESISVSDICDLAMVHRTTFYKHYKDKYDLLQRGMAQIYDDIAKQLPSVADIALSNEVIPLYLEKTLNHIAENRAFYTAMLCGKSIVFQQWMGDYFAEVVRERFFYDSVNLNLVNIPITLTAHFIAGSFVHAINWWLEEGTLVSIGEMTTYLLDLYKNGVLNPLGMTRSDKELSPAILGEM